MNTSHLSALEVRLSHERGYLAAAKTQHERDLRNVWISQVEKEIKREREFLGITDAVECDLSDDQLLKELQAA